MSEEQAIPLARLNKHIKAVVERETLDKPLWTGGMVSGVHLADSGHIYFFIVDGNFSIRCMLRENARGSISFTPQNGMEVDVYGPVAVYEERASIEIDVQQMRLIEGQVMTNFEPVMSRLKSMGLYPREKKAIPANPRQIVLVTSRSSEAESDFRFHYGEAGGTAPVRLIDVRVEGEHAPREIADAITRINNNQLGDVIVLTRGGGRRQALTVFDDFLVAEAICRSAIPIITAIGHIRDTTIADEVADMSKGTPTAAATYLAQLQHTPNPAVTTLLVAAAVLLAIGVIVVLVLLLS
jgi:exodeoxyribonuclease VII large subunit